MEADLTTGWFSFRSMSSGVLSHGHAISFAAQMIRGAEGVR
jgi:hypothetical protein